MSLIEAHFFSPLQASNFIISNFISHFVSKSEFIELGNIAFGREFNDVHFVCDSYMKLLTNAKAGEVYNICTVNPVSLPVLLKCLPI